MVRNRTRKNKHKKSSKKRSSIQKKSSKNIPVKTPRFKERKSTPNYALAVFFFCAIIGAYVFFYYQFSKRNNLLQKPFDQQIEIITDQRKVEFDRKYRFGYKIVSLNRDGIIFSDIDSLPEKLVIPWSFVALKRIPADLKTKKTNLVMIKIPSIQFLSEGINSSQAIIGVDRVRGASSLVLSFGSKSLYLEILEAYENQIICLFGLK